MVGNCVIEQVDPSQRLQGASATSQGRTSNSQLKIPVPFEFGC